VCVWWWVKLNMWNLLRLTVRFKISRTRWKDMTYSSTFYGHFWKTFYPIFLQVLFLGWRGNNLILFLPRGDSFSILKWCPRHQICPQENAQNCERKKRWS
jgi:hypothetical protein